MKTKDIIIIVAAVLLIGVSGYFTYRMIVPTNNKQSATNSEQTTDNTITQEQYDATLKLISEKKDYGEATLDNIGRTNPFGPLN